MEDPQSNTQLIQMLLSRLERISSDSYWAHRASGVRGALLALQQSLEENRPVEPFQMREQIHSGFEILARAGKKKMASRLVES